MDEKEESLGGDGGVSRGRLGSTRLREGRRRAMRTAATPNAWRRIRSRRNGSRMRMVVDDGRLGLVLRLGLGLGLG